MRAIAAMARNRVIGSKGGIPWHLPEDFRWFKRATTGGTVVMGRKTFESLPKLLPNRRNVVLSRGVLPEGVEVLRGFSELAALAEAEPGLWIIGGGEIYAKTLHACSDLYLSLVNMEPEGDAFFPEFESRFEQVGVVEEHHGFRVLHFRNKQVLPLI